MRQVLYHVTFKPGVRLADAEITLKLALLACEGVHGSQRIKTGCNYHVDPLRHGLTLRANRQIGSTVTRVLSSFLAHEFGKDAFTLRRRVRREPRPIKPHLTSRRAA